MNRRRVLNRLVTLFILASVWITSLFVGNIPARADGGNSGSGNGGAVEKCSADLLKIADAAGATHVKAIVQSSSSSNNLLDALVQDFGGTILATLPQLNARLVDISASSARALAYEDDISYMSLDNEVRSFGHITNTTGTQQSRAQETALGINYTLDGSNVNIAILDSGIDTTHKSFAGQIGKIVVSKDFTSLRTA